MRHRVYHYYRLKAAAVLIDERFLARYLRRLTTITGRSERAQTNSVSARLDTRRLSACSAAFGVRPAARFGLKLQAMAVG